MPKANKISNTNDGSTNLTYFDCGPNAFAVDVIIDFPGAPEIKVGDVLVIDPDKAPKPESIVLAAIGNDPVILRYRDIPKSARLVGVATERIRNLDDGPAPADDWPEFAPWLEAAKSLELYYEETAKLNATVDSDELRTREEAQADEMDRLCDAARTMAANPVRTDRHLAMLITLAVWGADKGRGGNFNVAAINVPDDDIAEATSARLLQALAPRAAATLPEVPFVFPEA